MESTLFPPVKAPSWLVLCSSGCFSAESKRGVRIESICPYHMERETWSKNHADHDLHCQHQKVRQWNLEHRSHWRTTIRGTIRRATRVGISCDVAVGCSTGRVYPRWKNAHAHDAIPLQRGDVEHAPNPLRQRLRQARRPPRRVGAGDDARWLPAGDAARLRRAPRTHLGVQVLEQGTCLAGRDADVRWHHHGSALGPPRGGVRDLGQKGRRHRLRKPGTARLRLAAE